MANTASGPNPSEAHPPSESVRSQRQEANLRLALVLASIAAAFFLGIVLKYFLFPSS
nr:hypothetical protein NCPCFENI_00144 [Cupriavidus sp.]